MQVILVM